jgi:multiple sugar transport system permease protein
MTTNRATALPRRPVTGPGGRIRWRFLEGYLFLGPNIAGFLLFTAIPVVASLVLSFTEWDLITSLKFVGLQHYGKLLREELFWTVVKNTTFYTVATVPSRMILSLLLATALNQKLKGITLFRTAYFMPVVSSTVAVALVWRWIYNYNFGLLNSFLWGAGIGEPPDWLNSTTWAMPAVIIMSVWRGLGMNMMYFLAGLQAIPESLYEAAEVDGANRWHRFRHITVPMLTPVIFFVVITSIIGSYQVFGEAFVLTRGGPANATTTIVYAIYNNAFEYFRMGKASALAWILFAIVFAFTWLQWRLQKRWVHYQ